MQDILDILTGHVSMAGFDVPFAVLVFASLLTISIITKESWWGIAGAVFALFFALFLPALYQI